MKTPDRRRIVPPQAHKTDSEGHILVFRATENPPSALLQLLFIQSLGEVRRIHHPVEEVGAELTVTTRRASEAPNSPAYGVFGTRSGAEAGIEGVFQQADAFHALTRVNNVGRAELSGRGEDEADGVGPRAIRSRSGPCR